MTSVLFVFISFFVVAYICDGVIIYETTKSAKPLEEIAKGAGWLPDGHGVLSEKITLSADGKSFTSRVRRDMFDHAGKAVESGIEGTDEARRMAF